MIVREPMAYKLHCHCWGAERQREGKGVILLSSNDNRENNREFTHSSISLESESNICPISTETLKYMYYSDN